MLIYYALGIIIATLSFVINYDTDQIIRTSNEKAFEKAAEGKAHPLVIKACLYFGNLVVFGFAFAFTVFVWPWSAFCLITTTIARLKFGADYLPMTIAAMKRYGVIDADD